MKSIWKTVLLMAGSLSLTTLLAFGQGTVLDIQGSARFGSAVSCAGDVNGDGILDLAAADDLAGTVDVRSGSDGSLIRQLTVPTIVANFSNLPSYAMTDLGDVNGDGIDDLLVARVGDAIVGLAGVVPVGPGDGRVFSGADGSVLHTVAAFSSEQSFGYAATAMDDINGDGIRDYAIGAPWASTQGFTQNGYVTVHSGSTGALIHILHGQGSFDHFGQSLANAGDMDSDGFGDFVVGSTAGSGTLLVISGASATQIMSFTAGSQTLSPSFGLGYPDIEVAAGEDIDGDNVGDYVLAKRGDETHGYRAGAIFVFPGATQQLVYSWFGNPCDGIGAKVELVDVNADGKTDVLSASRNDAGHDDDITVFSGSSGIAKFDTDGVTNDMTQISPMGDLDGDGMPDFLGSTDPTGLNPGRVVVVAGGPWLGQAAEANLSNLQGQEETLLTVNGDHGGVARRIDLNIGDTFSFEMAQPSTRLAPAGFVIFGQFAAPDESLVVSLPASMGDFAIFPVPMVPWAQPLVFTLASSLGPIVGGEFLPATLAPWSHNLSSGLGFPITFTLQGVIEDTFGNLKVTNGLIIRVK